MINIKYENETFWVKGSLDLGYLGKYINETWQSFDDDPMISIEDYNEGILGIIEDLREHNDSEEYGWNFLGEYKKRMSIIMKKLYKQWSIILAPIIITRMTFSTSSLTFMGELLTADLILRVICLVIGLLNIQYSLRYLYK